MQSIIQSFPVNLNSYDTFVHKAQAHIGTLEAEAAKSSYLGRLFITFSVVVESIPPERSYVVERDGQEEILFHHSHTSDVGFRQSWQLRKTDKMSQYDFGEEKTKLFERIVNTRSHKIVCSITGCGPSGRSITLINPET